jgi:ABC-type protease/lipase transport system fused ATPase/permease subunit
MVVHVQLFDAVMVLSKGACLYYGPRSEMMNYFAALGFPCPPSKVT